jgi:hypothetical protein
MPTQEGRMQVRYTSAPFFPSPHHDAPHHAFIFPSILQAHIALQRRNCDVAQENANLQFDQDGNSLHLKRVV